MATINLNPEKAMEVASLVQRFTNTDGDLMGAMQNIKVVLDSLDGVPQFEALRDQMIVLQTSYNDAFVPAVDAYNKSVASQSDMADWLNKAASNISEVKKTESDVAGIKPVEVPTNV